MTAWFAFGALKTRKCEQGQPPPSRLCNEPYVRLLKRQSYWWLENGDYGTMICSFSTSRTEGEYWSKRHDLPTVLE